MWEKVKLGDVCDLQNGFAFKSNLFKEDGLPILRISNIQEDIISLEKLVYFSQNDYSIDFERYKVHQNDLLIAMSGATTGKLGFNQSGKTFFLNQRVGKFLPHKTLNKKYLYYILSTKVEENLNISRGAAQPNLSTKQIKDIEFFLPPLAEQERIVAKLDAAFAEIDGTIEGSKKQETEVLKFGYRAITNKLKNLANIYSSKPLNDVVIIQPKKKLALEKISECDDVSFMGMKELGIEQKYSEAINTKPLNEVFKSYQYFEENDVVFAKITPCYENGKLGIMKNLKNGIGFGSSEFVVLRPNKEVHSEYIYYCLLDEAFRKNGTKNMSGAVGHKRVTKDYYFNYQIAVPPLSMQIECIRELDEIWKQVEIISKLKHKKINELISLKSAILKQELQLSEAA